MLFRSLRMINSDPAARNFVDTPLLDASPYFREVLATFEAPLRTVRLMRLAPGSVIKEHHDVALSFEDGTVRLHIPVVTNDAVDFRLNGVRVALAGCGPCGFFWDDWRPSKSCRGEPAPK